MIAAAEISPDCQDVTSRMDDAQLLPWADPYIAQLQAEHQAALDQDRRRRQIVRLRLSATPRRGALVVAS
ncbi:MAG: hypothetical protein KDA41_14120 [Planctomycetales bacterium]|nr:hypothetical protein [Planctomycetales bacterium]